MRWPTLLASILLLLLPALASAVEVRVGVDNNPPLTFVDTAGQARGLLPELLAEVAKKGGWSLTTVPCTWQQCLEKLETGQIDILPAIAYTKERAEIFQFAQETVFNSWGQVYQRPEEHFDSILQLQNIKIAVLAGDVYLLDEQGLLAVAENFGVQLNTIEVDSYQQAFTMLASGEVDAAMVGRIFGIKHRQEYNLIPSPVMFKPIQVRPAFSPQASPELKQQFDAVVSRWKKSPTSIYFQLLEKWLGGTTPGLLAGWLKVLLYSLLAILCLLFVITLWTRKQVKTKTRQLAEKNRQLEDELTERQRVEAELLEREQQYRALYEDTQAIMLLIDPKSRKIVDANPAACKYYGYSRAQLHEMDIATINRLNAADISEKASGIESRELSHFELSHYLADGEERQVEIQSSPIVVEGRALICSIIRDISQRKQAEQTLAERNIFLQSVLDSVTDPLMVVDLNHQVLQLNKAAQQQTPAVQVLEKTLQSEPLLESTNNGSPEKRLSPLAEVRQTGDTVSMIHTHFGEQGHRLIELNASPLYDAHGELYAIIEIARDITERQQIEELLSANEKRLHHLAHHDSLTDLPNRLLFEDRLKQALSKARRTRKQVALMFLDLDHFKDVNDNLGHKFGDLLLVDIAGRLKGCVRESDTVARMGGDEFLVLLDDIESIEMIETMAQRVCEALTHQLTRNEYSQHISASIGISIYPDDGVTGPEMMKNADIAMYRAKDLGKANYQFFSPPQGRFTFE